MLWEMYQQKQIASANSTADHAAGKADGLAGELQRINRHLDRLTLACHSMWELIRDNTQLTEADLEEMPEVDESTLTMIEGDVTLREQVDG